MTCTDDAAAEFPDIEPGAKEKHGVDFTAKLTRFWFANRDFTTNIAVRPLVSTGYQYRATTGGHSGAKEPLWPKTLAATVTDGSVIWTAEAISTTSLTTTVASIPTWTVDTGLTASDTALNGQVAEAVIDAASATDGVDYSVLVTATLSDGQILKKRCILPVRVAKRVCEC